jgi:hypothetical protein
MARLHLALAVGLAISLIGCASGLSNGSTSTRDTTSTRHTTSHLTSLAHIDAPTSDMWVTYRYAREFWIRSDGSGRIEERPEPVTFPSSVEKEKWSASGAHEQTGINQTFGPEELLYLSGDDIQSALAALESWRGSPGRAVDQVASLLAETAPSPDLVRKVIDAARRIPGVGVTNDRTMLILVGAGEDSMRSQTTVTIDTASMHLVSERRVATLPIPGLDADAPIVLFERQIIASEILEAWSPPDGTSGMSDIDSRDVWRG